MSTKNGRAGEPDNAKNTGCDKPDKKTNQDQGKKFVLNDHKFPWHAELLASSELSPPTKVVGSWLVFHGLYSNGKLTAKHKRIVAATGLSLSSVKRAVKELADNQFLWCTPSPGDANEYVFIPACTREEWRLEDEDFARIEQEKDAGEQQSGDWWLWEHERRLRGELFDLADQSGLDRQRSTPWVEELTGDARQQIRDATDGGRELIAHPLQGVVDDLRAGGSTHVHEAVMNHRLDGSDS